MPAAHKQLNSNLFVGGGGLTLYLKNKVAALYDLFIKTGLADASPTELCCQGIGSFSMIIFLRFLSEDPIFDWKRKKLAVSSKQCRDFGTQKSHRNPFSRPDLKAARVEIKHWY